MAVGFLRGAAHLEIRDVNQLGNVRYPYYDMPRVMKTARQTFALLSVICLAMTGLSAWLAFQKPATILLAPLILLASPLYFRHSWTYLNVDIVGATFGMLTVAACLLGTTRPSFMQSALVPGISPDWPPAASTLSRSPSCRCSWRSVSIFRARVVSAWALAVGRDARRLSRRGALQPDRHPGVPERSWVRGVPLRVRARRLCGRAGPRAAAVTTFATFYRSSGTARSLSRLLGLWASPRRLAARRRGDDFPVALFWLLTSQRVHFTRNALAIHPFVAMFAAFGFVCVHEWIVQSCARRGWALKRVNAPLLAGVVLLIATVPFWHFGPYLRGITDSRNEARAWIAGNLPPGWAIVVPTELGFDPRGLEVRGRRVKVVELRPARDPGTVNAS